MTLWMDETEITNAKYKQFVFPCPPTAHDTAMAEAIIMIDNLVDTPFIL